MFDIEKRLDNPETVYRPRNYWGWLENITPEETRWQIDKMAEAGMGGYVMHARGGLTMPYAGKQWMDSVRAMIDQGRKHGMITIIDDEHGWPSGFGAGHVNGKGEKYQMKYLESEYVAEEEPIKPHTLGTWQRENGMQLRIYYKVDPHYVDNMDPDVVDAFIEASYEDYYNEVGGDFGGDGVYGFFSDEPQLARHAVPWSEILPEMFEKEYGYALCPELYKVYEDVPGCEKLRCDLYQLIGRLFAENYAGRIGRWCEERGVKLMGHVACEDNMPGATRSSGETMPFYEYMSIPGIDWLGREAVNNLTLLQLTSAAAQLGKKRVLSEMFGAAGWSITPERMKWIAQWHHALGVDDQLQHLGLYSLRGSRKREYPASLLYQQPWFKKMKSYNDYFARVSKLIAESRQITDLLVLHTQSSGWARFQGTGERWEDMDEQYSKYLTTLLDKLLGAGICPHLGSETLMRRHGSVEKDTLKIGEYSYRKVLLPPMATMASATYKLLCEFVRSGGQVYSIGQLPKMLDGEAAKVEIPCTVIDDSEATLSDVFAVPVKLNGGNGLTYAAHWDLDGNEFYYITNNDYEGASDFSLSWDGDYSLYLYDPMENRISDEPFSADNIHLEGGEALILFKGVYAQAAQEDAIGYANSLRLDGKWKLESMTDNALTLDKCQLSLDGERYGEEEYILDIQKRLLKQGKDCDVWLRFSFVSEFDTDLYVLVENPEKCSITVNGAKITETCGWCVDKCLEAMPIQVQTGENEIIVARRFENDDRVYFVKNNPMHEAESNRVTVNTELESIYLWGQFGVKCHVVNADAPKNTIETKPEFAISPLGEELDISHLEQDGLLFFAGEVTLSRRFSVEKDCEAVLQFERPYDGITEVYVNGEKYEFLWAPYVKKVSLKTGENEIKVTFTNSCRNLFGPHYQRHGDECAWPAFFNRDTVNMYFLHLGIPGGIEIQF